VKLASLERPRWTQNEGETNSPQGKSNGVFKGREVKEPGAYWGGVEQSFLANQSETEWIGREGNNELKVTGKVLVRPRHKCTTKKGGGWRKNKKQQGAVRLQRREIKKQCTAHRCGWSHLNTETTSFSRKSLLNSCTCKLDSNRVANLTLFTTYLEKRVDS